MIVVVGLAFEARIAARSGVPVICGGRGNNLTTALATAIAAGCTGLVSFGIAGGLASGLAPGTAVVASAVVAGDARWATHRPWSQQLIDAMPGAVHGILAGAPMPVATIEAKRHLNRATGALAVDTESHVVAHVAAQHGLPMVALRVICDPSVRGLPESAVCAIRPDGRTDLASLLRSLARSPRELPALWRTALDARAARATLMRGHRLLRAGTAAPLLPTAADSAAPELRPAIG